MRLYTTERHPFRVHRHPRYLTQTVFRESVVKSTLITRRRHWVPYIYIYIYTILYYIHSARCIRTISYTHTVVPRDWLHYIYNVPSLVCTVSTTTNQPLINTLFNIFCGVGENRCFYCFSFPFVFVFFVVLNIVLRSFYSITTRCRFMTFCRRST